LVIEEQRCGVFKIPKLIIAPKIFEGSNVTANCLAACRPTPVYSVGSIFEVASSSPIASCRILFLMLDDSKSIPTEHNAQGKIRGFHGGNYEEYHLLGCDAVWLL
jgi:hypothetical protein